MLQTKDLNFRQNLFPTPLFLCHTSNMVGYSIATITELENGDLRLNVIFAYEFEGERHYIAIPGFRWRNGCVEPPVSPSNGKWYNAIFLSKENAKLLYQSVKEKLEEKNLLEKYPLNSFDVACGALLNFKGLLGCYPTMQGKI